MRVELRAIALAKKYYEREGYKVEDVSRKRGHNGYDFLVEKDGSKLKIEVKGATRMWGIPDPYNTEFDSSKRLVADFLCIVYFVGSQKPQICVIPRDNIPPEQVSERTGYRISSRFKRKSELEQFLKPISFDEAGA